MKNLIQLLYAYRGLFTFLLLESVSLVLVLSPKAQNKIQGISSSNEVIGNLYEIFYSIKKYPELNKTYKQVIKENAALKEQLLQNSKTCVACISDSIQSQFKIIPSRVINNSIIHNKNYITIDKGSNSGILPGMGVITDRGVVGKVKAVSKHFSTIISLIHTDVSVSCKIIPSGVMGTIRWMGYNPLQVQLLYIPRHLPIEVGNIVVTSGYNAIFYEGIPIGRISKIDLNKESLFYDIKVDLDIEFSTLQYVYVVTNSLKQEKDSLEQVTRAYYE